MSLFINLLIAVCAIEAIAFVALYARSEWHSPIGRHLMSFGAVLAILLLMRLWARLIGPLPEGLWAGGFTALALVLGWRLILVRKAQAG